MVDHPSLPLVRELYRVIKPNLRSATIRNRVIGWVVQAEKLGSKGHKQTCQQSAARWPTDRCLCACSFFCDERRPCRNAASSIVAPTRRLKIKPLRRKRKDDAKKGQPRTSAYALMHQRQVQDVYVARPPARYGRTQPVTVDLGSRAGAVNKISSAHRPGRRRWF